MITRDDMMSMMLAACPSFEVKWEEFLSEWVGNPILTEDGQDGSLPEYLALGDLARHLIEKLEIDATEEFPAVFEVVERWIVYGEHYVSEAAVVGLLEGLTSEHLYGSKNRGEFVKWLGPCSERWWCEVIDFWIRLQEGRFRPLSID